MIAVFPKHPEGDVPDEAEFFHVTRLSIGQRIGSVVAKPIGGGSGVVGWVEDLLLFGREEAKDWDRDLALHGEVVPTFARAVFLEFGHEAPTGSRRFEVWLADRQDERIAWR